MTATPLPRRRVAAALAVAAIVAACGTPAPVGHVHRFTTTFTVTDEALLPVATVTIPAFSTVVWRNRSSHDLSIEIESAACPDCDTVFGFVAGDSGARSVTLLPGAVATLCFHTPGTFPFRARLGGIEHRGAVEVGGTP